jgi:hypothetical protein
MNEARNLVSISNDSTQIVPGQPAPQSAPERLADVVADVANDARNGAEAYLDETRVPEGGE